MWYVQDYIKISKSIKNSVHILNNQSSHFFVGGVGKVTKWRYEPCITGLAPPCVVPSVNSGENRLEVHFIPSENIDVLGIQVRVSAGEEFLHFEDTIKNSSVVAGQPYALFVGAGPTEEWKGSVSTTHVTLFREGDRRIEICTEGEFFII